MNELTNKQKNMKTVMVSLDSRKFHLIPTTTINIFDRGNAVDPPEQVEINGGH